MRTSRRRQPRQRSQFLSSLIPPALPDPQLPPAPHRDVRWRLVERFKRSLFQRGSEPSGLKEALCKLLQASPELMEFGSTPSDCFTLAANSCCSYTANGEASLKDGITYQQMQGIIEELLEESGYYTARHSKLTEIKK